MCTASAALVGCRPDWRIQYCITIAMDAAPHPSFDCGTKGTSSQTPVSAAECAKAAERPTSAKSARIWGTERVQKHRGTAITFATRPSMTFALVDRDDDQDQCRD